MATAKKKATKTAAKVIASIGGKARAKALTAEKKTDIARKAATARWGEKPLLATHRGNFQAEFGIDVECYVLNDEQKTAVISQRGMSAALGLAAQSGGRDFPRFMAREKIAPHVVVADLPGADDEREVAGEQVLAARGAGDLQGRHVRVAGQARGGVARRLAGREVRVGGLALLRCGRLGLDVARELAARVAGHGGLLSVETSVKVGEVSAALLGGERVGAVMRPRDTGAGCDVTLPILPTHRMSYLGLGRWRVTGGAYLASGRWYPAHGGAFPDLVLLTADVTVDDDVKGADGMGFATPSAALAGVLRRVQALLAIAASPMAASVLLDLRTGRMEVV